MKICYIVQKYNDEGGIEKVVRNLISKVINKHEIHIITSDIKDVQDERIKFHMVNPRGKYWITQWIYFLVDSYFCTKKINKIENFDIIHKHGASLYNADVFTAHSVHKVALENNMHYQQNYSKKFMYFIKTLYPLSAFIEFINLCRSKKIVAVSNGIKLEIIKNYPINPKKLTVITNGISCNNIQYDEIQIPGISDTDLKLIFVGKDYVRKGLMYVLDALSKLKKDGYSDIKLLVLGEDTANSLNFKKYVLDNGLENNVFFLGHLKNINDYYAFSDIFVFPTTYEAFSIATLEASKFGLPLLCSKTNGTEDLIIDNYNGYFIDRNAKDIASKLKHFIENPDLISKMGLNAKNRVCSVFNWESISLKYGELYLELSKKKSDNG